jgi:hypothetical protein
MSALTAMKSLVRHYPGGRDAIALLLGKPSETLRKELDGSATHKLGLVDAMAIVNACAAVRSQQFDALAHEVARESLGKFALDDAGAVPLLVSIQRLLGDETRESSDMTVAVLSALDGDTQVSDNELKRIEREADEAVSAINRLVLACRDNNRISHAKRGGQ